MSDISQRVAERGLAKNPMGGNVCRPCQDDTCRHCAKARQYRVLRERINALYAHGNLRSITSSLDWDAFERRFERTFQDELLSRGAPIGAVEQIDWADRALKAEAKLAPLQKLLQSFYQ